MKIDFASLAGLLTAAAGIGWGLTLEGGSLAEMIQPSAALIVFGGSIGATLLAQSLPAVWGAAKQLAKLAFAAEPARREDIDAIASLSSATRRNGILAIERTVDDLADPFLRQTLRLGLDGVPTSEIREIMELRIERELSLRESEASVFETAGGFAPTVGILGAVLGLIQVMKHLEDIDEVGKGIAVAFVATIYGVGLANLLLLPAAKKILARAEAEATRKQMLLDGALNLVEGRHPRLMRARLEGYLDAPAEADDPGELRWPVPGHSEAP